MTTWQTVVSLALNCTWPNASRLSPIVPTSKPSLMTIMQRPWALSVSFTLSASCSSVAPLSARYIWRGSSRPGSARRAAAGMKPILRPIAWSTSTGSEVQAPAFSSLAFCTMWLQ